VSTGTETIVHAPWCDHRDDEEQQGHECDASLSVDLSHYPPQRNDVVMDGERFGWETRSSIGVLLSCHDGEDVPYVELAVHVGDETGVALTVAEATQLAAALTYLAAKAAAH
jgi:hypothetical protein